MRSCSQGIERTRALLGTFVRVRLHGLTPAVAHEAMDRCFAEAAEIHRLMSFQEPDSDVSRLNRQAHLGAVQVDERTCEVLSNAARLSEATNGVFDVTVASSEAAAPMCVSPDGAPLPDSAARWTDIELLPDCYVRFARPLWIDLSGIAKGYAVDRAIEIISSFPATQACVNAGGDLRVAGREPEWVRLSAAGDESAVPLIEIHEGSVASSAHRRLARSGECAVAHIDGIERREAPVRFVTVLASMCWLADALTKVVMARGNGARSALRSCGARALMQEAIGGWQELA